MQGNGSRPNPADNSPEEQPPSEEEARRPAQDVSDEDKETFQQQYRVLRIIRQNADQKFNSDILAAGIIIFVLVLCSLAAWGIWAYALSRPAHNANPSMNIVLAR